MGYVRICLLGVGLITIIITEIRAGFDFKINVPVVSHKFKGRRRANVPRHNGGGGAVMMVPYYYQPHPAYYNPHQAPPVQVQQIPHYRQQLVPQHQFVPQQQFASPQQQAPQQQQDFDDQSLQRLQSYFKRAQKQPARDEPLMPRIQPGGVHNVQAESRPYYQQYRDDVPKRSQELPTRARHVRTAADVVPNTGNQNDDKKSFGFRRPSPVAAAPQKKPQPEEPKNPLHAATEQVINGMATISKTLFGNFLGSI